MRKAKKLALYICAATIIAPLSYIPALAQSAALEPDAETVKGMERDCAEIVEKRLSSFSAEERKGQTKEEMSKTCVENAKLQYFSVAQNQLNQDSREQTAAIQTEYENALAMREASIKDAANEHEAKMEQWRQDVAACKAGNISRCAPPAQ